MLVALVGFGVSANAQDASSFVLKKNSKIIIESAQIEPIKKGSDLLEEKMRKLGFCCVSKEIDEEDSETIIAISPDRGAFRFRIYDRILDREVFNERYVYLTTLNKVIGNFIKDITPFIEK